MRDCPKCGAKIAASSASLSRHWKKSGHPERKKGRPTNFANADEKAKAHRNARKLYELRAPGCARNWANTKKRLRRNGQLTEDTRKLRKFGPPRPSKKWLTAVRFWRLKWESPEGQQLIALDKTGTCDGLSGPKYPEKVKNARKNSKISTLN